MPVQGRLAENKGMSSTFGAMFKSVMSVTLLRHLSLASMRTGQSILVEEVPSYHLHLHIDRSDLTTSDRLWLEVADVLTAHVVKPNGACWSGWKLYHKEKKFGETKIGEAAIDQAEYGCAEDTCDAPSLGDC